LTRIRNIEIFDKIACCIYSPTLSFRILSTEYQRQLYPEAPLVSLHKNFLPLRSHRFAR